MNTSHDIPQPTPPIQAVKTTFYNVCLMYDLDYPTLEAIAKLAKVDKSIMDAMFATVAIHRVDALKILASFSAYVGKPYTLDTVKVALLPSFADICTEQKLDLKTLAISTANVPYAVFDMMRENEPVPEKEARLALSVLSLVTGKPYSLENVDVALVGEEEQ